MIGVVTSSKTITSYENSWKTLRFKLLTPRSHLKTGQISFVFHAVSEELPEQFQRGSALTLCCNSWHRILSEPHSRPPADWHLSVL